MKRHTLLLSLTGAVLLTLGAVGAALASIPDPSGVIHGCYARSGELRVIDSSRSACTSRETALSWSQTGPQGPAGPAGPPGPQGAPGPAGAPGVSGYQVVTASQTVTSPTYLTASCPGGQHVLGGGGQMPGGAIIETYPSATSDGWTIRNGGIGVPTTLTVYAICANVRP